MHQSGSIGDYMIAAQELTNWLLIWTDTITFSSVNTTFVNLMLRLCRSCQGRVGLTTRYVCCFTSSTQSLFLWQGGPVQLQTSPRETNHLSLPLPEAGNGTMHRVRLLHLKIQNYFTYIGNRNSFHHPSICFEWSGWGLPRLQWLNERRQILLIVYLDHSQLLQHDTYHSWGP